MEQMNFFETFDFDMPEIKVVEEKRGKSGGTC